MREGTAESTGSSPLKDEKTSLPKKREHHYEEIENYIDKITSDIEHVERTPYQNEGKLQRQTPVGVCDPINDPIFDEFSRELNKTIRRSLSAQDDKIRQELAKKIPKIEELEKQISDEDREEKIEQSAPNVPVKQLNLLAPISSIDSTSSDEDNRRQLSILAEESETSDSTKKRSFEIDSSIERDVESLIIDESDASMTLIEEEVKRLEIVPEERGPSGEVIEKLCVKKVAYRLQPITASEENGKASQDEELNLKEDVVVKRSTNEAAPKKISDRWSKMRLVSESLHTNRCDFLSTLILFDVTFYPTWLEIYCNFSECF